MAAKNPYVHLPAHDKRAVRRQQGLRNAPPISRLLHLPAKWRIVLPLIFTIAAGVIASVVFSDTFGLLAERVPRIAFDTTTVDFAEQEEGDQVVCVFSFRNKGNNALLLKGVKTSCGCLVAKPSKLQIPAGHVGELVATYDTTGRNGRVQSTLLLFTNDPDAPNLKLTLLGNVKKPYIYNPHSIDFGKIRIQHSAQKTLIITKLSKRDMQIADVQTSKPWLTASIVTQDVRGSQHALSAGNYQLAITLAPNAPIGPIREELVVSLAMSPSSQIRNIRVPVRGFVQGDLICEPESIFFGAVPQGEGCRAHIAINSNQAAPLLVRDVSSKKGLVKITGAHLAENSAAISIELAQNLDTEFISDAVIVSTNSKTMPRIEIPVYARIIHSKRPDTPPQAAQSIADERRPCLSNYK